MERFPWHPRLRPARIARPVAVTAATALTLAVVAAVTIFFVTRKGTSFDGPGVNLTPGH